ncbi:MAG: hypothetical protein K2X32_05490 [Phycisphaerales bacterium]|nr:hypothetical protein [Phycisphaerales bacterium]
MSSTNRNARFSLARLSPLALLLAAATLVPVTMASAEPDQPPAKRPEGGPEGRRPGGPRPDGERAARPARPLTDAQKKFDANSDGKLDEAERTKFQDEMKSRVVKLKASIDTSGDGKISADEWKVVSADIATRREEMIKRIESGPPAGGKPGDDANRPEGEGRPPREGRPGGEGRPPREGRPGGEGGPGGEGRPPREGRPGGEGGPGRRLDTNGDGKIDDAEKAVAMSNWDDMQLRLVAEFDADADGKLSADEKTKFEAAVKERREGREGREGRPGPGGPGGGEGRRGGSPKGNAPAAPSNP